MFVSYKYSYLVLRLGLAAVFLWFGIDKLIHPDYWLNAWVSQEVLTFLNSIGVSGAQFMFLNGIFEILVGLSLITGVFAKFFSALAIVFLVGVLIFIGVNEVTIRDFGLIAGFASVILWPTVRDRF